MFRIGEFARFTRVSVKMLRHYDAIGLLAPARVDDSTGYRFYSTDQLPTLNRIIALKDLGFSLDQIRELLASDLTIDQIRGMLKAQRAQARAAIEDERRRLRAIEARLLQIERSEAVSPYDVVLRPVAPLLIASIRRHLEPSAVTSAFEALEAYCARHDARAVAPPLSIDYSADPDRVDQDIEVALPIRARIPESEGVVVRLLEGWPTVACVIYGGAYEEDRQARGSLLRWIEANRYRIAGPPREVYLRFGADQLGYELPDAYLTDVSSEFVTEIQIPVMKEEE